jgi:hypothetical protein
VRPVAIAAGIAFAIPGAWALVEPRSFFDTVARFEPFNQHFIQDIGAFQLGLGAVLLLAATFKPSGVTTALAGTGIGSAFHTASHFVGRDLGGVPERDIPLFSVFTVVLLAAALWSWRADRRSART